jgi:hypothetical protein
VFLNTPYPPLFLIPQDRRGCFAPRLSSTVFCRSRYISVLILSFLLFRLLGTVSGCISTRSPRWVAASDVDGQLSFCGSPLSAASAQPLLSFFPFLSSIAAVYWVTGAFLAFLQGVALSPQDLGQLGLLSHRGDHISLGVPSFYQPAVSFFPVGLSASVQRLTLCLQFLRHWSAPVALGGALASLGELPRQEAFYATFKSSTISGLRVGRNGWSVCSPQPLTSTWMTFCEPIPCGSAPPASRPTPWVSFHARPLALASVSGIFRRG